jgi:hypothetical protein
VIAGTYIVWFWSTNLRSGAGALGDSGPFRFVEGLSQRALDLIGNNPLAWGLGLGAVILAAVSYVLRRSGDEPVVGDPPTADDAATRGDLKITA